MENQNNLTASLFRFVTLRMPELTGSSAPDNSFVTQAAPEAGTMYGLVQTYGSLQAAAARFTPFSTDAAMKAASPMLFTFSDWLAGEGVNADYNAVQSRAASLTLPTDAALKTLWDNLFYQMATGRSDSQREVLIRALVANNLAGKIISHAATADSLAALRRAKVVIPKEIIGVVSDSDGDTPAAPAVFRGSKSLSDCLDILAAKDMARRYEAATDELVKVKAAYDKDNAAALATARAAYEVTVKGIIDALPTPTDPTAPPTAPPDFPAFEFTPAAEMQDSVLAAHLSAESYALLQSTSITSAPTFSEALQRLDKGLKTATATVFEKTRFYTTTVVMAGVQMPNAKSLPTERNGFMTKAFEVAPGIYKVAVALNTGGGTGSDVFAISSTDGDGPALNFGDFESFEINGLSGVLVEVSGDGLTDDNGEIGFSANFHLDNGRTHTIVTQSPVNGGTGAGKTLELLTDTPVDEPVSRDPSPIPSSYGIHKLGVADYMRVSASKELVVGKG